MTDKKQIRVLVACRFHNGMPAPFVADQVEELRRVGCDVEIFNTEGNGISGYIKAYFRLRKKIDMYNPDIIHAHYGMTGLLTNLQRKVPVVTTYHGSDINKKNVRQLSKLSMVLSKYNIFVSKKNIEDSGIKDKYALIPCGVNIEIFNKQDRAEARKKTGLKQDGKYVLFAGRYDVSVKNAMLAKEAMQKLSDIEMIELRGYDREQVATLMNAADCLLMTSISEGSPQVIKEAIATGCPIVSVDVGDVKERTEGLNACTIIGRNASEIAKAVRETIEKGERIEEGVKRIKEDGLDNGDIAKEIVGIYKKCLNKWR